MKRSIIDIKKTRRQKDMAQSRDEALKEYERKQAEIKNLLKQITDGIKIHGRNARTKGGHGWGYVGDLANIAETLTDIRDRLHNKGEYAKVQ